jgi:hypothetical protein
LHPSIVTLPRILRHTRLHSFTELHPNSSSIHGVDPRQPTNAVIRP